MKVLKYLFLIVALLVTSVAGATDLNYTNSGQWTFNQDVAVQGDFVATTCAYGLQLWDMSTPSTPVLEGQYYVDGDNAWAVEWQDSVIYVTTVTGHLYALDEDLNLLSNTSGLGANADIKQVGSYLYSAGNASHDFQIWDVSDPESPSSLGWVGLSGSTKYLTVDAANDVSYVVTGGYLYTIDISTPSSPAIADTDTLSGTHMFVSADNGNLAIASTTNGFDLFDVSTPDSPTYQSTTVPSAGNWPDGNDLNPNVRSVVVSGDTLYVVCNDVGLVTYDISNLSSPSLVDYDPILDETNPDPSYYVFTESVLSDSLIYSAGWSGFKAGVVIFDPTDSEYLGRTRNFDYCRDVDALYSMVFSCTGNSGVVAHKHLSTGFEFQSNADVREVWGVDAVQQSTTWYVFAASTLDGLVSINWTNFLSPTILDTVDVGQARQVLIDWPTAYVACFSQGVSSVDVTDPSDMVLLDTYDTFSGDGPVNLDKYGDVLAVAERSYGVSFYDVSDPESITLIANLDPGYDVNDVDIASSAYTFIVSNNTVMMVNTEDPENPYVEDSFGTFVTGISISNRLYVSRGSYGVAAYQFTTGTPTLVETLDTPKTALSLKAHDNLHTKFLYVADYAGLDVIEDNSFDTHK